MRWSVKANKTILLHTMLQLTEIVLVKITDVSKYTIVENINFIKLSQVINKFYNNEKVHYKLVKFKKRLNVLLSKLKVCLHTVIQ